MDKIIERIVAAIMREQQLRINRVDSVCYDMSNSEVVHIMEFEPYEIEKIIRGVLIDESQIGYTAAQQSINAQMLRQLESIASDVHHIREHGMAVRVY